MKIKTVTARPDGFYVVNAGLADACEIALIDGGPLAGQLIDWLRETEAAPWPRSLAEIRATAQAEVLRRLSALTAGFVAGYTAEEVAGWAAKTAAAQAQLAGEPQAILSLEAAITGEDPNDLAEAILTRAAAYQALIAQITGLRRTANAAIAAAQTPDAVAAALQAALAQAEATLETITPLETSA